MRKITGVVTSTKMQKTIVVRVDTHMTHPKYKKRYKVSNKFYAHDESETAQEGDTVTILESRPLSKLKRWTLVQSN
ncbi:MAG: 30S ribosomal protein S17 [Candidatus Gracilibacteria bacterium]